MRRRLLFILLLLLPLAIPLLARPTHLERQFLSIPTNISLAEQLLTLTHLSHIAGSEADHENALFVAEKFKEFGFDDVSIPAFSLFLSYPQSSSLTAFLPTNPSWSYNATLQEPAFPQDPYSNMDDITPTFHGYSPSGNVRGPIVYVNYGRKEDFALLQNKNINVNGSIILARYGKNYRGAKVRNAALAGAVGVLLFSDPQDYNPTGEKTYPDGPGLPLGGVQRGSVVGGAGDPLTPGWPSARVDAGEERDAEIVDVDDPRTGLPLIPSMPISAADALPLLMSMEGEGAPRGWVGDLQDPNFDGDGGRRNDIYKIGRGPVIAHLEVENENKEAVVWDVIAVLRGEVEPDRFVILGNHRDAWTFGAVDPNSGTACLLEIGRALGELHKSTGWRPRRSILLASWDAEEHCLGGSTEWGEEKELLLQQRAVAYLNVDSAVAGPGFWASATPSLDEVVVEATKLVVDPDDRVRIETETQTQTHTHTNLDVDIEAATNSTNNYTQLRQPRTIYETWNRELGRMGDDGSDHGVFVQHLGIPSTMLGFKYKDYPMYHSTYDNYMWMSMYGDPGFHRHLAVTQVWGLVGLSLTESEALPLNYVRYGEVLEGYVKDVRVSLREGGDLRRVDLRPMEEGLRKLQEAARGVERERWVKFGFGKGLGGGVSVDVDEGEEGEQIQEEEAEVAAISRTRTRNLRKGNKATPLQEQQNKKDEDSLSRPSSSSSTSSSTAIASFVALREFNDRLMLAERGFLDFDGLQGPGEVAFRKWLRHLVYSPPGDNEYGSSSFPGVVDAIAHVRAQGEGGGGGNIYTNIHRPGNESVVVEGWKNVQHEIWRAGRALERVAGILKGSLL